MMLHFMLNKNTNLIPSRCEMSTFHDPRFLTPTSDSHQHPGVRFHSKSPRYTPLKFNMEPENHPIEKGSIIWTIHLHDFGFQPLIFRKVSQSKLVSLPINGKNSPLWISDATGARCHAGPRIDPPRPMPYWMELCYFRPLINGRKDS